MNPQHCNFDLIYSDRRPDIVSLFGCGCVGRLTTVRISLAMGTLKTKGHRTGHRTGHRPQAPSGPAERIAIVKKIWWETRLIRVKIFWDTQSDGVLCMYPLGTFGVYMLENSSAFRLVLYETWCRWVRYTLTEWLRHRPVYSYTIGIEYTTHITHSIYGYRKEPDGASCFVIKRPWKCPRPWLS